MSAGKLLRTSDGKVYRLPDGKAARSTETSTGCCCGGYYPLIRCSDDVTSVYTLSKSFAATHTAEIFRRAADGVCYYLGTLTDVAGTNAGSGSWYESCETCGDVFPCSECGEGPTVSIARVSFNGVTLTTGTTPGSWSANAQETIGGTPLSGSFDLPFLGESQFDEDFNQIPIHVVCRTDRIQTWHQSSSFGCVWGKTTTGGPTYTASDTEEYIFPLVPNESLIAGITFDCIAITVETGAGNGTIRAHLFTMIGVDTLGDPNPITVTLNGLDGILLFEGTFTYEGDPCAVDVEDIVNTAGDGTVDLVML